MKRVYTKFYTLLTNPFFIASLTFSFLVVASFFRGMGIDEGIWSYIATSWVKYGMVPYKDLFADKTPGIHIIYAVSYILCGVTYWLPRLFGCVASTLSAVIVYLIAKKLYGRFCAGIAMMLCGLALVWESTDGLYCAQTESFMIFFSALAFYLVIIANRSTGRRRINILLFSAGMAMGSAISFKQIALTSAIALFIFYTNTLNRDNRLMGRFVIGALVIVAGIITALALSVMPVILSGATIADYWRYAWVNLAVMVREQSGMVPVFKYRVLNFCRVWRSTDIVLFYPFVALFFLRRKELLRAGVPYIGICAWLILDFIGVNSSGHYWTHQVRQLIPPIALVSGMGLSCVLRPCGSCLGKRIGLVVLLLFIVWLPYNTMAKGILEPDPVYFKELGLFIKRNTTQDDYVYLFAPLGFGYPMITQAYCERRSPTRYFSPVSLAMSDSGRYIAGDIMRHSPKFIIVPSVVSDKVPVAVNKIISMLYRHTDSRYGFDLYEQKH